MHSRSLTEYSTKSPKTHSDDWSDFDCNPPIDDGPDEVLLAGIGLFPAPLTDLIGPPVTDLVGPAHDGSRKVSSPASEPLSKKVRTRKRRSVVKDMEAYAKIQNFVVTPGMAESPALVAISNPSHSPSILHKAPPHKPSNDNVIPDWEKTDDWLKLVFANEALEATGRPAVSWTLNLSPSRVEKALKHQKGFVESLKRHLDEELLSGLGYKPLYWFGVGVARNDRHHLHGAIAAHPHELPVVEAALLRIAGKWESRRGAERQLVMNAQWCDAGWVQYAYRNVRSAQKVLKGRVFTITGPLRAEAKELYGNCRDVMRSFG